jgi:hypothetical protein
MPTVIGDHRCVPPRMLRVSLSKDSHFSDARGFDSAAQRIHASRGPISEQAMHKLLIEAMRIDFPYSVCAEYVIDTTGLEIVRGHLVRAC